MGFVRSPIHGAPRGRLEETSPPPPHRDSRERRSLLALEISNADPTGRISVEIDPAGPGAAYFETRAPVGPGPVVAATVAPEFVAIDPTRVLISVGAGPGFHEQIDLSVFLALRATPRASAVKLNLDAAPGTSVRAVMGVGSVWSLDSGTAILPLTSA